MRAWRTFNNVSLVTAGMRTITATDTANSTVTGKEQGITVIPAAASYLVVACAGQRESREPVLSHRQRQGSV